MAPLPYAMSNQAEQSATCFYCWEMLDLVKQALLHRAASNRDKGIAERLRKRRAALVEGMAGATEAHELSMVSDSTADSTPKKDVRETPSLAHKPSVAKVAGHKSSVANVASIAKVPVPRNVTKRVSAAPAKVWMVQDDREFLKRQSSAGLSMELLKRQSSGGGPSRRRVAVEKAWTLITQQASNAVRKGFATSTTRRRNLVEQW